MLEDETTGNCYYFDYVGSYFLCSTVVAKPTPNFSLCVCVCALPQQLDYKTVEKLFINATPPGVMVAFSSSFSLVFMGSSAQCDF